MRCLKHCVITWNGGGASEGFGATQERAPSFQEVAGCPRECEHSSGVAVLSGAALSSPGLACPQSREGLRPSPGWRGAPTAGEASGSRPLRCGEPSGEVTTNSRTLYLLFEVKESKFTYHTCSNIKRQHILDSWYFLVKALVWATQNPPCGPETYQEAESGILALGGPPGSSPRSVCCRLFVAGDRWKCTGLQDNSMCHNSSSLVRCSLRRGSRQAVPALPLSVTFVRLWSIVCH